MSDKELRSFNCDGQDGSDDKSTGQITTALRLREPASDGEPLTVDVLAERVLERLPKAVRNLTTVDYVRKELDGVDLSLTTPTHVTPRLLLHRLIFSGVKKTEETGKDGEAFRYDRPLAPGVNVLVIEDNKVGKSSVMKTIKFALTGDDGDYDNDVKDWIRQVWLQFTIGGTEFTHYLVRTEVGLHGILVFGFTDAILEHIDPIPGMFFDALGTENVQQRLQQFFFDRIGLEKLSWVNTHSRGLSQASTSWKTYFQALYMPDSSDQYLMLDAAHAMGNQQGLILSSFLGLRLVQPYNRLGFESSLARRQDKASDAQVGALQQEVERLTGEATSIQRGIAKLRSEREAKLQAFKSSEPNRQLTEVNAKLRENVAEQDELERKRGELRKDIRRQHATAKHIREAIAYRIHFSGLDVSLCPNCETGVDPLAVARERETHHCRLCGKLASGASAEDLGEMEAKAAGCETEAHRLEATRSALGHRLQALRSEYERLDRDARNLNDVLERGIDVAVASVEEEGKMASLYEQFGSIRAQIAAAKQQLDAQRSGGTDIELRQRIMATAREIVSREADSLNQNVLHRLSTHIQDLIRRIGVESVTDLTCSMSGTVDFKKNGVSVRFTTLKNPGERLRLKLAFFLALMRIGREPGAGRHPGLLLIDQPGSAEMIDEDFAALADILRQIDAELSGEVQIVCFTARTAFRRSTAPEKVYGATAGKYVF